MTSFAFGAERGTFTTHILGDEHGEGMQKAEAVLLTDKRSHPVVRESGGK